MKPLFFLKNSLVALGLIMVMVGSARAVQIGDLVRIKGSQGNKLVGMGLVVGLKGTGDGGKYSPAIDPLARVVRHFIDEGTVSSELRDTKNVALVALEALVPAAGVRQGDHLDVHVSAVGSSKSLRGGRLLMMPMTGPLPNSPTYAFASGPVTVEDDEVPTVGIVRHGAQVARDIRAKFIDGNELTLVLRKSAATFQTAVTIAATINNLNPDAQRIAMAIDQKNIVIKVPEPELSDPAPFVAEILSQYLDPGFIETGAQIRINERTGTIVMSGDVQMSPVAISHGGLVITMTTPEPKPTQDTPRVDEHRFIGVDPARRGGARLSDLISAFNQLKVGVRDRIAIIREIHSMGKLHAQITFDE